MSKTIILKCSICGEDVTFPEDHVQFTMESIPGLKLEEIRALCDKCFEKNPPSPGQIGFQIHKCAGCGRLIPWEHDLVKDIQEAHPDLEFFYYCDECSPNHKEVMN